MVDALRTSVYSQQNADDGDDQPVGLAVAADCSEVYLVAPRYARITLVSYGHQFNASACHVSKKFAHRDVSPMCRSTMLLPTAVVLKKSLLL